MKAERVSAQSMLFMVTERRAYAPIEGGQSLAEAYQSHIDGPSFLCGF
jgi:hypothetical protein